MIGSEALVLPKLSQITVNGENKNFETIDQVLFTQDGSTLICYPAARHAENYTVPQGVKRIEIAAFQNADVKNITIPDTVTQIGKLAFRECTSLTTVNIPDKIERIESQTFYGCAALTEIVIPASVKSIGDFAFSGTGLSFVVMPDSVENEDGYLFFGNKKLTHVYLSRGMGSLSSSTLYNLSLIHI